VAFSLLKLHHICRIYVVFSPHSRALSTPHLQHLSLNGLPLVALLLTIRFNPSSVSILFFSTCSLSSSSIYSALLSYIFRMFAHIDALAFQNCCRLHNLFILGMRILSPTKRLVFKNSAFCLCLAFFRLFSSPISSARLLYIFWMFGHIDALAFQNCCLLHILFILHMRILSPTKHLVFENLSFCLFLTFLHIFSSRCLSSLLCSFGLHLSLRSPSGLLFMSRSSAIFSFFAPRCRSLRFFVRL